MSCLVHSHSSCDCGCNLYMEKKRAEEKRKGVSNSKSTGMYGFVLYVTIVTA